MMNLNHLPNQRKGEKVELFLRRHWLVTLRILVTLVVLAGVPMIVFTVLAHDVTTWLNHPIVGPVFIVGATIYAMAIILFSFVEYADYYLDTWIVTNERIINIEQKGLFNRVASELQLNAVQDVTSDVKGLVRTLFDYGDVVIQTAGEVKRFHFKGIPNPEEIKERVIHLVEQDQIRHGQSTPFGQIKKEKE
jgi:uncharacterized membrane protein YdbT with pleckstrin-like domain